MAKVFEPSYTTNQRKDKDKDVDLSFIPGILMRQAVAIALNSESEKTPIFQPFLPAAHPPAARKPDAEARKQVAQEKPKSHGERVLFVDDEESMVFLMERWLERLGYKVTGCTVPQKALEMFRSRPHDFDIVLSDLSMPEMSGIELAREILQIRPGMPILITSGYVAPADNEEVRSLGLPDLLLKPNTVEELAEIIHGVLANCESSAPAGQTRADSHTGPRAAAAGS
jgi:CheY-like chemotaxis protein